MLHCAQEAHRENLPAHFILCGDGAQQDALHQYVGTLALQNVSIIPMQNRNGVQEVLNVTDAAFISYLPAKVLETGSPNKYFDALAAGKLIVVNFHGWIQDEIETNKCGIFVENQEIFVKKIKPFIDQPELLREYQQNARIKKMLNNNLLDMLRKRLIKKIKKEAKQYQIYLVNKF